MLSLTVVRFGLILVCGVAPVAFGQGICRDLDASRLKTGAFYYRTLVDGKDAGGSRIQVRKSSGSGDFVYSNVVSGAFSQNWESVASAQFAPRTAKLVFGVGDTALTAFELSYREGRVNGYAVDRKAQPPVRRTVDEGVAENTIDQRIDWAAVMSFPAYERDRECTFRVYDPGTGNSLVHVEVGSPERVEVPAGGFEGVRVTYRIEKNRGAEVYRLTMDRRSRFLVKEEFPNGAVTELVKIEP
jgi:hypothetical protein